jgi:two-component system, cell cycle response regulator DivK
MMVMPGKKSGFDKSMYRLRVLVVEDTPENMELMCLILEQAGHEVYQAYDGEEGVAAAFRHQPDVILLDLALPKKDGWTVAAELKSDIITRRIPIIAISANSLPNHRERALRVGCNGFIAKPFRLAELKEELEQFLL